MGFRHIVLLTFTPDTTPEEVDAIADALRTLPPQIPELRRYAVGRDLSLQDGNAHLAVIADTDDQAGWETYRDHPAHQKIITEQIRPRLAARTSVQHLS